MSVSSKEEKGVLTGIKDTFALFWIGVMLCYLTLSVCAVTWEVFRVNIFLDLVVGFGLAGGAVVLSCWSVWRVLNR
ncbi:hypothetical protein I3271_05460 [Photobacterium leiognathi]|uniref:hypothetical protein n=1 Tax=Photobacterium leiognathi TaxID=553611 RepID=UPI001EE04462|nr:hypothetical protein [Photobacterium leiognathi]MCG3884128.1 hypothetical protein [Photobacterium leiognathi]